MQQVHQWRRGYVLMPSLAEAADDRSASSPPHLLRRAWAFCHSSVILLLCCAILFLILGVPGTLWDSGKGLDEVIALAHLASGSLPSAFSTEKPSSVGGATYGADSLVPILLLPSTLFRPPEPSLSRV